MTSIYTASSTDDLPSIAQQILAVVPRGSLIVLIAEMGSGKTTLSQALCRELGVTSGFSSPTYSIVNQYCSDVGEIYHIDLYRLASIEEALGIGIEDYLYPEAYTIVEWPQLIEPILPERFWRIDITVVEDGQRRVVLDLVDVTIDDTNQV